MVPTSKLGRWRRVLLATSSVALLSVAFATSGQSADKDSQNNTASPIKHVIVLIGENRTFDHVFATYVPKSKDSVSNLLSKGIVNADGSPGPNFSKAAQFQAIPPFKTKYFISLNKNEKAPYFALPAPTLNFAPIAGGSPPPFPAGTPATLLAAVEPSLDADDLNLLTTGAVPTTVATQSFELPDFDSRIQNFANLSNGPVPLQGAALPFDSYTGDTTHRLFEMWQQSDCNIKNATRQNPSGCLSDLYPLRDHELHEPA